MAASLATLAVVQRDGVQIKLERLGNRLIEGLNALVRARHVSAIAYAEPLPAMPFFKFTEPDAALNGELTRHFFREVLARGALLHPRHMWFLSAAHTEADVDATLGVCESALGQALELTRGW